MSDLTIGFAITGSFCTFKAVFPQMNLLVEHGYHVLPIMSENVYTTDTRFGRAADWVAQAEEICGEKVIHTIAQAEPIGPKKLLDLLILAPCTGNTLGKLACGIYDTAPTLAVKSHRRNGRPVLIAVSTNDALAGAAAGIGLLMNRKGTYFVPLQQDDYRAKPTSCVADFAQILPAAEAALAGRQRQPMILGGGRTLRALPSNSRQEPGTSFTVSRTAGVHFVPWISHFFRLAMQAGREEKNEVIRLFTKRFRFMYNRGQEVIRHEALNSDTDDAEFGLPRGGAGRA